MEPLDPPRSRVIWLKSVESYHIQLKSRLLIRKQLLNSKTTILSEFRLRLWLGSKSSHPITVELGINKKLLIWRYIYQSKSINHFRQNSKETVSRCNPYSIITIVENTYRWSKHIADKMNMVIKYGLQTVDLTLTVVEGWIKVQPFWLIDDN